MRGQKRPLPEGMTYKQWYMSSHPRPSRRKDPNQKCRICELPFTSKFINRSKNRRIYCDDCITRLQTRITRMYQRRAAQKRNKKWVEKLSAYSILRKTRIYSGME